MNILVDDIGRVVEAIRSVWPGGLVSGEPHYMYGHKREINQRLLAKDVHRELKWKKYPLIALVLDFPEEIANGIQNYTLNIGILHMTEKNFNAEERYQNVFKPVLYPLYDLFLKSLRESGLFMWPGDIEIPPHTKLDRPYWGTTTPNGNDRNIFSDPLDAIEILNLKINQREVCQRYPYTI